MRTKETVMLEEKLATERAFAATKHIIMSTFRKLEEKHLQPPPNRRGGAFKLVGAAIAHAYMMGRRAGAKKRWLIEIEIDSKPKLSAAVYIQAIEVVKTSHDLVEADGIPIALPGKVVSVREH